MKRFLSTVVMGSVLAVALAGNASAFDNSQAGIALHVGSVTSKNACSLPGLKANTINYQEPSSSPGRFYYTYLLVCNASDSTGIKGVECGIQYQNPTIQVYNWNLCATLEFPSTGWPNSGGGNLVTWNACQNTNTEGTRYTVIAVAGYFYMGAYGPSTMSVTPRPNSGFAKVADCSAREDDLTLAFPSHLGVAGFAGQGGYNPCGAPTPVQNSTWGAIKSLYNN